MADIQGAIHLVKMGEQKVWATFARYAGGADAGAVPHREFDGPEALDTFLRSSGVFDAKRLRALGELRKSAAVTVGFIRLSTERLKALGLVA